MFLQKHITNNMNNFVLYFRSVIAFRSANKLGFFVDVTPDSNLTVNDDVWMTFSFKYDHVGISTLPVVQILKDAESEKKPEITWITQTVYVNLGKVMES